MAYSIVFIAPFKKLGNLFMEVCQDLGKEIRVEVGDLEKGVQKALALEKEQVDVIISRGGTAIAIKKSLPDIPVVEVLVHGFDLIYALHQARQKTRKIVVAGFAPFTYECKGLGKILDLTLEVLTFKGEWYDQAQLIEEQMQQVKERGFHFVVGDNISIKIAQKLKMDYLLIRSGKEALSIAIKEAEKVAWARRNEMKKTKRIQSIIDSAYEGIISIDERGFVETFNPQAEVIFNKKAKQVLGCRVEEVLPEANLLKALQTGKQENGTIWTLGSKKIAVNIIPIEVNSEVLGVVATCQDVSRIQKMEQKIRNELYLKGHVAENTFDDIIGESKALKKVKEEALGYARLNSQIMIWGETGTGKELIAQACHNASSRRNRPFVAFNCAAIPDTLLESEFFGYVEGAFTGAKSKGKPGLFEQAHEGTIFLDEIGEISQDMQVRLLRVLQEKKVRRLGDDRLTPVDVRVIVATNKDISQMVNEGTFRMDLYYRINVLNLYLPPLRERKEDIPLLSEFFFQKYKHLSDNVKGFTPDSLEILKRYSWPGNIRQLENIIERLIVRARNGVIDAEVVKEVINSLQKMERVYVYESRPVFTIPRDSSLDEAEKLIIQEVLREEEGKKVKAAERLKISRATLWRKLKGEN